MGKQPQLQISVDFIIEKSIERKPAGSDNASLNVTYLNSKRVAFPKPYLELN